MRVRLEISPGRGYPRRIHIESGQTIKVGRTEEADVAFPEDRTLSREHLAIECDAESCRLRDLGSSNGTYLNGRRVGVSGPLKSGDVIEAGQTTLKVHIEVPNTSTVVANSITSKPTITSPSPSLDDRRPGEVVQPAAAPEEQAATRLPDAEASSRPHVPAAALSEKAVVRRPSSGAASRPSSVPGPRTLSPDQFVVGNMYWEDLEGVPRMTVIIKVTCAMPFDGPAPLADNQLPIFAADVPGGDDPTGPVRFESDMVPLKPKADVVLVGKAHCPRNKHPDTPLDVTLRVGTLVKKLRVIGDRTWCFPTRLALIPEFSNPEPFKAMDLVYERAFGGIDQAAAQYCAENLAGRGFIGKRSPESIHGKPLPNIEDPTDLIRSWDSRPRPAGFAFYGRGSMPRLKLAGTPHHPPEPQERLRGLPSDFSYAFFNGAHPDLQVEGHLKGDEEVELTNLSAVPYLEFRLPAIQPRVTVAKWTTPPTDWIDLQLKEGRIVSIEDVPTAEERVRTVLDTLVLIPEERIFYMVFRGNCKLGSLEQPEVAHVSVRLDQAASPGKQGTGRTGAPPPRPGTQGDRRPGSR